MMRAFPLIALLVFLAVPACSDDFEKLKIQSATDKVHTFNIEIAETPEQKTKGLMGRERLPENQGMLFVFSDERLRGFWMKDVPISLDIIFIKQDGVIGHIHHNAKPYDETVISSQVPAFAALEINGGLAEKLNITVGNQVDFKVFGEAKFR